MAKITIGGITLEFSESSFTAAQWEQVASWVLNGGGEAAAENARIALRAASDAAKSAANVTEYARNSESYAVGGTGTREGEDTDNAKFYCEQSHAIAGEGLVFSVNGQQADEVGNVNVTKDNIGLDKVNNTADTEKPVSLPQQQALDAKPNPNLLHNWYFANPVNQRGYVGYSGAIQYTIDRWKQRNSTLTVEVEDDCITLDSPTNTGYLAQYLENAPAGTYTLSALVKSVEGTPTSAGNYGAIYISDGSTISDAAYIKKAGLVSITVQIDKPISSFQFQITAGCVVEVIAAKLELGTQQTLAHQDADGNWALNEIPDYGEQLALCQRYFFRMENTDISNYMPVAYGVARSADSILIAVPLPVIMRASPAVSFSGVYYSATRPNLSIEATDVTGFYYIGNMRSLSVNGSGLTEGAPYGVYVKYGYIDFIADL